MNTKKKEKLKNLKDNLKDFFVSQKPHPKKDWTFMLKFFFGFLFFLTTINTFLFFYWSNVYDKETVDTATSFQGDTVLKDKDINLNKEKIDSVWNFFKDKEINFNKIEKSWFIKSPLSINSILEENEEDNEDTEKTEDNEEEEKSLTEELF
jgi:hypothetical protein